MSYLPCIEIEPRATATAAVIWLHGLGADGHDFEPIVPELRLPANAGIRFVFPNAPSIPVTLNRGHVMPAWYDILDMNIGRKVDERQLLQSAAAIAALIEREIDRGIPSQRIVIAGFSQGGAVGYQTALSYPKPLGGLLALSTYLATQESLVPHAANAALPIQICHGSFDPIVPAALGRQGYEKLLSLGYHPQYKTYPMEHSVCAEEIADISAWLQQRLP